MNINYPKFELEMFYFSYMWQAALQKKLIFSIWRSSKIAPWVNYVRLFNHTAITVIILFPSIQFAYCRTYELLSFMITWFNVPFITGFTFIMSQILFFLVTFSCFFALGATDVCCLKNLCKIFGARKFKNSKCNVFYTCVGKFWSYFEEALCGVTHLIWVSICD